MSDLSEMELKNGMEKAKNFTGFFTLPAFRELCKGAPEDFGMPCAQTAYREACCKQLPWERQQWSHKAVYAAARETGRFELHSFTEREVFPLFKKNYETMVKRVMAGEDLNIPVIRMLPERVHVPLEPEKAKARCRSILESLK